MPNNFKWVAPWEWSKRTRQLRVGKLIDAYVHPCEKGYYAKINEHHFGATKKRPATVFTNLTEAKRVVESEVTKMISRAYKQIVKRKGDTNGK